MQLIEEKNLDISTVGPEKKSERLRSHKLSLTCLCIDSKDEHLFTGSKDGSIVKWNIRARKICAKIRSISQYEAEENKRLIDQHHIKHINCIAISSGDKFIATGGWDKLIRIWSPENLTWVHTFNKHRQEITCLAFRLGHPFLYSGSADRSVMLWTLEEDDNRTFVEDLYGHESPITSMDVMKRERVLTSGGRDQTIRIWKIVEQAQTVFEAKHESVDIVKYINDKYFISGGEDGSIYVWSTGKRTPLLCVRNAHPLKEENSLGHHQLNSWITSLACHPLKKQGAIERATQFTKKKKKLENGDSLITSTDDDDRDRDEEDTSSGETEDEPDEESDRENCTEDGIITPIAIIASGSCNSEIRLWRLEKSGAKYCLKFCSSIPCLGFINDLRFTSDGKSLAVACGQEHKFGRWWKIKKSKNCMKILSIPQELQ